MRKFFLLESFACFTLVVRRALKIIDCEIFFPLQWSDSDSEGVGGSLSRHHHHGEGKGHSPHHQREDLRDERDEGIGMDLCQESESWLAEHVSFPYWESRQQSLRQGGAPPTPAPSAHPGCHLATKW